MIGIVPGKESSEYRLTVRAALAGAALVVAGVALASVGLPWSGLISAGAGTAYACSTAVAYVASRASVKGTVAAARVPKVRVGL